MEFCFDRTMERVDGTIRGILEPLGFECYPFKIGWYNEQVKPVFHLDHAYDTLAYIIISTPHMFDKAFKPFITRGQHCDTVRDPIDECIAQQFTLVQQALPDESMVSIHDFELLPSRRPRVLVQTAGHVAGAARYYQKIDVKNPPWPEKKSIYGVSVHPRYGGWFALRGVLIFPNLQDPDLQPVDPPNVLPTQEKIIEVLDRFNGNWRDYTFRDVIEVEQKYSDEQKLYFATEPKDRKELVANMVTNVKSKNSETNS